MKKHIPAVCATLAGLSFATPSSNNFHSVTNDWYNGNFSNVYELAQMRLSTNATDVVGAYLMLDWDLAFSDYSTISNAMMRVVSSSDLVAAPAFSNAYEKCRHLCLSFCENYIPHQKESTREAEQANSRQPCGFMTNQGMLKILWDEGLW